MSANAIHPDDLTYVCSVVRERSAIELEASKSYLIEARLAPLAKRHGFKSSADFLQNVRAKRDPELERRLVEAMTTNETSFFRDSHPFDALRSHILTERCEKKSQQRALNIWSAACSTGQEIYSIAMLLHEHFPSVLSWNLKLYATDLSDEVLERARAARFSQIEVNRGLPESFLAKYFHRDGTIWRLSPPITSMVQFSKLNLIEPWPQLPRFDIVFLRNVLIYFAPEAKKRILQRIREVMAPGAVLFLGAAETTMGLDAAFQREQVGSTSYHRAI